MSDEFLGATPDDDAVHNEVASNDAPVSMEDTIAETLNNIRNRDAESDEAVKEVTEQKQEAAPKRPRDSKGKFAANATEEAEAVTEAAPAQEAQATATEETAPPGAWKKEAKEAWHKADPVIRAEVARREADFHKGIEQYRGAAQFANAVDAAITPFKQTLQSLGLTPDIAIRELMSADHKLRYGSAQEKHNYFAQLAHTYGIDINHVANVQKTIDPNVYRLEIENNQLRNQFQLEQQRAQQQVNDSLNSEIATFASDPKHSHFDSVKGHMAALLQAGHANTLAEAYEQAIYANPATRQAVLQQQAQESKAVAAQKAQAAKSASSVNVKSRPAMPVHEAIGTMEDTMKSVFKKHGLYGH